MAEVLLITALVVGLFYFLFIRPTRREQSRRTRDLNALRIGDEVLTRGGLIATVISVETPEDGPMILSLELADGVVVRARTEAVEERLTSAEERLGDEDDDALDDEAESLDSPAADGADEVPDLADDAWEDEEWVEGEAELASDGENVAGGGEDDGEGGAELSA